jgi:type VI secretion system protein ImpE
VIGGTQSWLAQLVTCLSLERQGHTARAAELRIDAFEVAPEVAGSINGAEFALIADADSRLGPVLEVIVGGSYYWAPFACMQRIEIERSSNAGQLAWLPARFTWRTGESSMGFIPVRYPGSEYSDDEAIRLSQETQWQRIGEDCYAGLGQRQLGIGTQKIGILDVRDVQFSPGGCATHA